MALPLGEAYARMAILPFHVGGEPDGRLFSRKSLPYQLQEGTEFLFSIRKRFPLLGHRRVNQTLLEFHQNPGQILSADRARRICARLDVTHLMAGSLVFLSSRRILSKLTTYSCTTYRRLYRYEKSGSLDQMQALLRTGIVRVTPFAHDWPRPTSGPGRVNPIDLALLVDFSGSMAQDLPVIRRGVAASLGRLPAGSRVGVIALLGRGRKKILPYTKNFSRVNAFLRQNKASGEVSAADLAGGLVSLQNGQGRNGPVRLLILSDVPTQGRRLQSLEDRLRFLKGRGMSLNLFTMSGQGYAEREEWRRLSRSLGAPAPDVIYARRMGFLEGRFSYMLQKGNRFYLARHDLRPEIAADSVDLSRMRPLETFGFDRSYLNLKLLPGKYAAQENLRLDNLGPIISTLETRLESRMLAGIRGAGRMAPYRVLVKHQGHSFWIGLSDVTKFRRLRAYRGRKIYLGLQFYAGRQGTERLVNRPETVYIRDQGKTPRLFINYWSHLSRLPAGLVKPDDIWFLLVEIKGFKNVERERDIRE